MSAERTPRRWADNVLQCRGQVQGARETLLDASHSAPLVLFFARPWDCPHGRADMRWLAAHRLRLRDAGCLLGVVYMGDNRKGADWLTAFGLMDVMRVHDPDRLLYAAFGMVRMSPSEIEGPATGAPGSKGRGAARGRYGDMLQLGGVVVLRNGACVHRHPQQRLTEGVDWSRVLRVLDTGPGDAKWGRPAVVSPGGGRE